MGRKIEVDGPAGKAEVKGSYDPESRTVHTDDGKKIHLGGNDRATVHPECFVATAVYGSPEVREVQRLREFRDFVLQRSFIGRRIVALYYRVGPRLAEGVRQRPRVRHFLNVVLHAVVSGIDYAGIPGREQMKP